MTSSSTPRPLTATIGFGCWLVAAVLLMVGGLLAASADLPSLNSVLFRGSGVLTALAGLGMAFLAGRSRTGDPRFRRAAIALSLAIVVLVGLTVAFGVVHIVTLFAVIVLVVGTILHALPTSRRTGD